MVATLLVLMEQDSVPTTFPRALVVTSMKELGGRSNETMVKWLEVLA